ncbi:hypothetical protein EIQ27_08535 [Xanthomonas campestris pv. armoraciae]
MTAAPFAWAAGRCGGRWRSWRGNGEWGMGNGEWGIVGARGDGGEMGRGGLSSEHSGGRLAMHCGQGLVRRSAGNVCGERHCPQRLHPADS